MDNMSWAEKLFNDDTQKRLEAIRPGLRWQQVSHDSIERGFAILNPMRSTQL
jgi:hypothetical protein